MTKRSETPASRWFVLRWDGAEEVVLIESVDRDPAKARENAVRDFRELQLKEDKPHISYRCVQVTEEVR